MKISITSIELKGPFKFFALSREAMYIMRQLRSSKCQEFKKQGFWTTHYTMSLWNNEEELREFAASGAHREAMRKSAQIAREIRTLTLDGDSLPDWKTAREKLQGAKVRRY